MFPELFKWSKIGFFSIAILAMSSCMSLMQGKKVPFALVNVLDKQYFDDCHIKGAINVTMEELETYAHKNWDKETTEVVVHCANYMCTASAESARMLQNLGFKKVYAYEGGTAEWKQHGYPIAGPSTASYLKSFEKPNNYAPDSDVKIIEIDVLKEKFDQHLA